MTGTETAEFSAAIPPTTPEKGAQFLRNCNSGEFQFRRISRSGFRLGATESRSAPFAFPVPGNFRDFRCAPIAEWNSLRELAPEFCFAELALPWRSAPIQARLG
uniref:hypothetical protein n=1 Tax=Streptomyces hawaiiensis TaxID=67305 RepID=UPI0031CF91DD